MMICVWFWQPLRSQTDTLAFSLEQAQAYATEHGYQVKSASYEIESARKKVWEYLAMGLPQVNAFAGVTNNLTIQSSVFTMSIDGAPPSTIKAEFGQQYNWNAGFTASQLIFDGSYFLGVMASKIVVELSELQKQNVQIDLRGNVAQAYFLMVVSRQNLANYERNLRTNELTLVETEAYVKNGFMEQTDLDQMKLIVSRSRNLLVDARRQFEIAAVTLKFLMGIPLETLVKTTTPLQAMLDEAMMIRPDAGTVRPEQHISHQLIATQERIQGIKVRNEKFQYLPKINLGYNLTHVEFGESFSEMNQTTPQALELKLSLPVFSSGMRMARVKQEKLSLLKIENEKFALEQSLKRVAMLTAQELSSAKEKYENDVESERIADAIYSRTRLKFTKGMATSSDLTLNEQQFIQSQTNTILSVLNLLNARVEYQKALAQY